MIDKSAAAALSHKSLTNLDAGHWWFKSEVGSCSPYCNFCKPLVSGSNPTGGALVV